MQLYTIGHSVYPIDHFLSLLKRYNVQYVLDVRSTPYSQHTPQYDKENLQKVLGENNIKYFHMKKQFGARQLNRYFYTQEGYLNFEVFRQSNAFKQGIESVKRGLKKYNIALLCTEKDPIDCHRAIMVARGCELEGIDVKHILHDGSILTQKEFNRELLDLYFPERLQTTLDLDGFGELKTDEEYLVEAYRKRNKKIGWHLTK